LRRYPHCIDAPLDTAALAFAMFEEFHLAQTLLCGRFAFVRPTQIFTLFGQYFVAALHPFDHVPLLRSFWVTLKGSQSTKSLMNLVRTLAMNFSETSAMCCTELYRMTWGFHTEDLYSECNRSIQQFADSTGSKRMLSETIER